MIETIMIFALGALTAALLAIALLPALWRRAVRLTRMELEATLPLTPGEFAAEKDQIRAATAVDIRKIETRLEASDRAVHQARLEVGEKITLIQQQEASIAAKSATIDELTATLAARDAQIETLEDTIATLERERDNLATNLSASRISNQSLEQVAANLRQVSDQSQVRIADQERQLETATARLSESQSSVATLKADLAQRTDELRETARMLRDATDRASQMERRTLTAETLTQERQAIIDDLTAERLRLIEELGMAIRERDHERVEHDTLVTQAASHASLVCDLEAAIAHSRSQNGDLVRDLTRTIEHLRQEKRQTDDEISTIRFEKVRLEAELQRLKKKAKPVNDSAGSVSAT